MTASPLFSVVLPTYNRALTLRAAIDSVLNQTLQDFELLVIDDNSSDDTPAIISGIQFSRLRYIRHPENRGVAAARNTGIEHASGLYISFLDSDDLWERTKLETEANAIKCNPQLDLAFSYGKLVRGSQTIGTYGYCPWVNPAPKDYIVRSLFLNNFIPLQGLTVRKTKMSEVGGFDESFKAVSDYECWLRLVPICTTFFIDKQLLTITFSRDCITIDIRKKVTSHFRAIMKNRSVLRGYTHSTLQYLITLQRSVSGIFSGAAWDADKRAGKKASALALYAVSFLLFPNRSLFRFLVRSRRGKR